MRTGIRTRLLVIIALATLIPLVIAVLAIQTIGYRHLVKERGGAFQAGASHIADSINLLTGAELREIDDFIKLDRLHLQVEEANKALEGISESDLQKQIQEMEDRWPGLQPTNQPLAGLLHNPLADRLAAFRARHPLCAEIMVTDRKGRLVASTGKTSDYWQADEEWWQKAAGLKYAGFWIEGLQFDDSSATFSLDVSVPIKTAAGDVAGVLKASLNASPLFSSISPALLERRITRDIVRDDGTVLLRLFDTNYAPAFLKMDPRAVAPLRTKEAGWMVRRLFEEPSLAGFATLRIRPPGELRARVNGLAGMFVVVHEPASLALMPLRKQVTLLTLTGGALFLVFGGAGLWLANRRIILPVGLLRSAADAVAATVQPPGAGPGPDLTRKASEELKHLAEVQTGDELETLAADFHVMGERVLRYQQQLEEEIAAKTATIQRDLDMAREFQTALMPSSYPAVPEGDGPDQLSLFFHHIYRPALTVGGDFFDVFKLSDHQAGIFIADVMGHGARSALVTAILRTLLQTYARQAEDPATLLAIVNREFHQLTHRAQQTLFVTASYMVADTLNRTLTCASAGHPSPLLAHRQTGEVESLFRHLKGNPALGLFPAATYTQHSHPLVPGDLLVLFTDGVLEALNAAGQEFGVGGLRAAIKDSLGENNGTVIEAVNQALAHFIGPEQFTDDVCLVTIEIRSRQSASESLRAGLSQPASVGL